MGLNIGSTELNPFSRSNSRVINIVILCTACWIITLILGMSSMGLWLTTKLMFSPIPSIFITQPWSILTYIFLHGGVFHLLSNMLWLYFLGTILEDMLGRKHIWRVFLGGGITGAVLYMIISLIFPKTGTGYMIGASGGVLAVVLGAATHVPRFKVYLFGVFAVQLIWIAFVSVLLDLAAVFGGTGGIGGNISHLGGALYGALYVLHQKGQIRVPFADRLYDGIAGLFRPRREKVKVAALPRAKRKAAPEQKGKITQEEVDAILDKINRSGYESLTPREKEKLFRAKDEF